MRRQNITIVDGKKYKPGDEIWDLGSFVATSSNRKKRNYEGLSKDIEKLPHYVDTGSSAFCLDTGDYYKYLRSTDTWYKIKSIQSSGSGGVSDYKDLNGKPQINGVTLQGNLTLQDLGLNESNTPIGEIISYMGNTAPDNYLICDGSEYNISEYQELANHFTKEFGSANYFGGDGETTFSVPDLRGEFLRGSGNNSHINSFTMDSEGNGNDVGKHQSATVTPPVGVSFESNTQYMSVAKNGGQMWDGFKYEDSASDRACNNSYIDISGSNTNKRVAFITSRPTNTSVLYCIKFKATYNTKHETNISFNEDGNLVVTINDIQKVFSPKQ